MTLELRDAQTKVHIGVVADAANGGFPRCLPESTLDRLFSSNHPYSKMWERISAFYVSFPDWDNLSNEILRVRLKDMQRNGFVWRERSVSSEQIDDAAKRWLESGWTDYEIRRSKKIGRVGKVGLISMFALTGISPGGE